MLPGRAAAQALAKTDPRAVAMGGAYVAVADGWAALQWNPAGLWVTARHEVALSYGSIALEGGPWVEALRVARGLPGELPAADAGLVLTSRGAGLAGEQTLGAYVTTTRFGGGFQQTFYVDEISEAGASGLRVRSAALRVREFQVSGAHAFSLGRLVIGGSAKIVRAQAHMLSSGLGTLSGEDLEAGELLSAGRDAPASPEDTLISFDVGVLVIPSPRFRFGGVMKNVNAPLLKSAPEGFTRLPRQIRIGGLMLPHPSVKLSLDLDLSTDSFVLGGRERREVGGGVEWSADAFAVRGGMLFDLQAVERRPLYTFGIGLIRDTVRLDVAGTWAPDRDGFGWLGALAAEF